MSPIACFPKSYKNQSSIFYYCRPSPKKQIAGNSAPAEYTPGFFLHSTEKENQKLLKRQQKKFPGVWVSANSQKILFQPKHTHACLHIPNSRHTEHSALEKVGCWLVSIFLVKVSSREFFFLECRCHYRCSTRFFLSDYQTERKTEEKKKRSVVELRVTL